MIYFIFIFLFIVHTEHSFFSLLSSHFLSCLPIYPTSLLTLAPSQFRKGQASHGLDQSLAHKVKSDFSSSPCIKAGQANPAWGTGSQMPAKHQGQVKIPLLGALQTDQIIQLSHTHKQSLWWFHVGSLTICSEYLSSHKLSLAVSVGSPSWTWLSSLYNPPPLLHLFIY